MQKESPIEQPTYGLFGKRKAECRFFYRNAHKTFRDEEIAFVYIYREPVNTAELVLQTEEVEEVQWFDLEEVYEQCGKHREIFCVPALGLGVVRRYLKSIEKN